VVFTPKFGANDMTCRRHCWVWQLEGQEIAYACAHCPAERHRWVPLDLAGDQARAAGTLLAHGLACIRPARWPRVDALPARSASASLPLAGLVPVQGRGLNVQEAGPVSAGSGLTTRTMRSRQDGVC
jgi:hypothetical protein